VQEVQGVEELRGRMVRAVLPHILTRSNSRAHGDRGRKAASLSKNSSGKKHQAGPSVWGAEQGRLLVGGSTKEAS